MSKANRQSVAPKIVDGVSSWHTTLWSMIGDEAQTLSGIQVAIALRAASEEVYAAGLDHRFAKLTGFDQFEDRALAFDITWLSVFMLKLAATNEPDPVKRARKSIDRIGRDHSKERKLVAWMSGE